MIQDPLLISRAVIVWIGHGKTRWPQPDKTRLIDEFGPDEAKRLLPIVQALEKEFFTSDAGRTVADIGEVGRVAAAQFRQHHPELTDEAVKALTNLYTWTYK